MDYKKIYDSIITRSRNRVIEGYTEKHHVLPRCMGGTDNPDNIAVLTAQEHFVCHLLLSKLYPGNSKLMAAAMFMTGGHQQRRYTNKVYAWLRERWSQHMRENNPQKRSPRSGARHHFYGKKLGPDHISPAGKKILATKMRGERNPCSGIKPWKHPRATNYTKSVWARAQDLYGVWLSNGDPSYFALYNLANGKTANGQQTVIAPYMNIVKYFRKGWVPTEDIEWNQWKDSKDE